MKNESDHIENWIHEYLRGTISQNDKNDLFRWLAQDTANATYFNQISDIWLSSSVFQDTQKFNSEEAFIRVKRRISDVRNISVTPPKRTSRLTWQKAAAILIPIVVISGLATRLLFPGKLTFSRTPFLFEVPYGSQSTVSLPDGSKVILNAGSKLTCNEGFGITHRKLNLVGEGYFIVAKNKNLPFVVHADNLDVKALGTEFNIKAYPEDKTIETILIRGSIQVNKVNAKGKEKSPLVLLPEQTLLYNKKTDSFELNIAFVKDKPVPDKPLPAPAALKVAFHKTVVDPVIYTSWKDSSWTIYQMNLSDLAIQLERKYNVRIHFCSEDLKKIQFTGTLRDESLEQILAAIRLASPIEYSIKGKQVELDENKDLMSAYKQYYHIKAQNQN